MIKEIQRGISRIQNDVYKIQREQIKKKQADIILYFQDNQIGLGIRKGTRKDGVIIGWYAPATEVFSQDPHSIQPKTDKIAGEPYTMEWSGDLFNKMYIYFEDKNSFTISSRGEAVRYFTQKPFNLANPQDMFTLTDKVLNDIEEIFIQKGFFETVEKRLNALV